MASTEPVTSSSTSPEDTFEAVERYEWDKDAEFQSGLSSILSSNPPSDQAADLALRARCFYYTRKFNVPVDFDAYSSWRQSHAQPTTTNGISTASDAATSSDSAATAQEAAAPAAAPAAPASDAPGNPSADASDVPAPYPSSFARIVELITTGQPIPGIKQIPDTVLSGQSSRSTAAARRKPWERDAGAGAGAAGAEGVAAGSEG